MVQCLLSTTNGGQGLWTSLTLTVFCKVAHHRLLLCCLHSIRHLFTECPAVCGLTWTWFACCLRCLLCTDVPARGLNISVVNWITQYDPSQPPLSTPSTNATVHHCMACACGDMDIVCWVQVACYALMWQQGGWISLTSTGLCSTTLPRILPPSCTESGAQLAWAVLAKPWFC